jgi:DNA polymerase alpha subunit A
VNEIASVSVVCGHKKKIDYPMPKFEWNKLGMLGHFSILRKLDGGIFPMEFTKEVTNRNTKVGSNILKYERSERALLNRMMIKLHQLDPDVLVGHNISRFDPDVLLHREQVCKVPSNMWSETNRLKHSVIPKLSKGIGNFGTGEITGVMSCIARVMSCITGWLLCDT